MASSSEKQRQQKILNNNRSYLQEEVVNTRGTEGAPSFSPAQTKEQTREDSRYQLMEQVVETSNMYDALYRVERNKGAAGIDGMPVKSLREFLKEGWSTVREQLLQGTYQPKPVRRVEIPKPDGGKRMLGIPTVLDRLIQQAILQVLTLIFDKNFSKHSYGFRPKRSAHQAVKAAQSYIKKGFRFVVDMDLEKFFDKVNHDILMAKIARKVKDKRLLRLIRR